MFLVREAVLFARSSMEEEELDRVGEATELMEFDLLETLSDVEALSGVTAMEFDLLERFRLDGLTLSGVTAMEFDLADDVLVVAGLGVCSELLLSDPVHCGGESLAWSEVLLREPVLCILLLQLWLYCCLTAALLAAAGSRAEFDLWTLRPVWSAEPCSLLPLRLPPLSNGRSLDWITDNYHSFK